MATFTSIDEIKELFGDDGYDAYLDDLSSSQISSFLSKAINFATLEISSRTQENYLDDEISANQQIRTYATVLACHFISERRGNASLWEGRVDRIYEWLEQIRTGAIHLAGESVLAPEVPVVRNHVVNFNSPYRILVDKRISTGEHDNEHTFPSDTFNPYN